MNSISLIGRIAKDPEVKYTTNNNAVLTFTLAIPRRKKEDGTQETDWITCVAWNATAELIGKYVHKGDQLGIAGKLQSRSWETEDGKKRSTTEVLVTELTLIGGRKAEEKKEPPEPGYYDGAEEDTPF